MTSPPTLSEMQHALGQVAPSEPVPPTLSEMTHILETQDDVLEHYGIKGMKWGIRRSPKQLASIRDGDGEEVGSLTSSSRKVRDKIKSMKAGQVALLDTDDGPMITIKQKDGTFREVKISADQESVLRTMRKDPSEMSTRELKEATARAEALDKYNKLFNPTPDVNKELQDRVNAMKLQKEYSQIYGQMNPSATKRVVSFINDVKAPAFSAWQMANKVTNNALNDNINEMLKTMNQPTPSGQRPSRGTRRTQSAQRKASREQARSSKKSSDYVYDITTLGKDDYMNPYVPELDSRRS